MPRSLLSQILQVDGSATYNDTVSNPHTPGVAEAQDNLEGDLNVFRSLLKDLQGTTNWYDSVDLSVDAISGKYFIQTDHSSGFDNVATGTGTSTTAFDTAIKDITNHNNGSGSSTSTGVILNSTRPYRIEVRDHDSQDPIDDGDNNEVYGRLSWDGSNYIVNWYSNQSGTETAYNFTTSVNVDVATVLVSYPYKDLTWDRFIDSGFHDVVGPVGTIDDDSVAVNGMNFLLNGLTTQAQINDKLDKLGSTANGEGASGIAIENINTYYSGDDVEAALTELDTQIGGDTSSTYDFTENNVLADNDPIYPAINKLDLKWGDLSSVNVGEGASLVGIEDAGNYTTATDVESAIQELYGAIEDVSGWQKYQATTTSPISSGANYDLPDAYTVGSGANLDVYFKGQLLMEGAGNDYQEVSGSGGTGGVGQISFLFTVPNSSNLTFMIRK